MAKNERLTYVIEVDDKGTFTLTNFTGEIKNATQAFNALEKQIVKNSTKTRTSVNELKALRNALIQSRDNAALTEKEYAKFSQRIDKVNIRIKDFTQAARGYNKVNGDMQNSAGLAGAAALELGRTISDLPYGIRGIANNLQQVVSLFVTLTVSVGGAGKAFSEIIKQLRGPLGVLLAFQALISLIEYLSNNTDIFTDKTQKMTKAMEGAKKEVASERVELEGYVKVLNDANTSSSARLNAINEISNRIPGLVNEQGKLKVSTTELTKSVENYIEQQALRAELDIILEQNQEAFLKRQKIRQVQQELDAAAAEGDLEKQRKIYSEAIDLIDFIQRIPQQAYGPYAVVEDIIPAEKFREQTKSFLESVTPLIEQIEDIQRRLQGAPPKDKDDPDKDILKRNEFRIQMLKDYLEKHKELLDFFFVQEVELEAQKELRNLKIQEQAELASIIGLQREEELKTQIVEKYEALRNDIREKYNEKLEEIISKSNKKALEESAKSAIDELKHRDKVNKESAKLAQKYYNEQLRNQLDFFNNIAKAANKVAETFFGGAEDMRQREIAQLEARTRVLLENDRLTEAQRVGILKDAEEQKRKINERAIKAELELAQIKAGIEAGALLADILSTAGVVQLNITEGASKAASTLNPLAIAAYAVSAAGIIAQLAAAKRKANTALELLNSQAGGYGVGGFDSGVPGAPIFNVVGATGQSQIAEVISQVTGDPIRAYIVYDDIQNAEQYTNSTFEAATIGTN